MPMLLQRLAIAEAASRLEQLSCGSFSLIASHATRLFVGSDELFVGAARSR